MLYHPLERLIVEYLLNFSIQIVICNQIWLGNDLAHEFLHDLLCLFFINKELLLIRLSMTPCLAFRHFHFRLLGYFFILDSFADNLKHSLLHIFFGLFGVFEI